MKNGLFKKSMSVFLAVLMLLSSWVFVPGEHHLHAEAASGTVSPDNLVVITDGNSRADSSKITICSDGGSNSTSIGFMKFNISALSQHVTDAYLNINIGNYGSSNGAYFDIFSIDPGLYPTNASGIQEINAITGIYNGNYSTAANAYSYFGTTSSLGQIKQTDTGVRTIGITDAVSAAKAKGQTYLCLAFIMPQNFRVNTSNWSDTYIYWDNAYIGYTTSETVSSFAPSEQLSGGVAATFSTSPEDTATSVFSIDTSDSLTYYLNIVNCSTQTATIKAVNDSGKLEGFSANVQIPAGSMKSYKINKSALGTSDGSLFDFGIAYTLDNVYLSDGTTIAEFYQAAYIGSWHRSDDPKEIGVDPAETNNTPGAMIKQDEMDLQMLFQVSNGTIKQTQNNTGHRTANVTFGYKYWLDNTNGAFTNWSYTGLRMFTTKWTNRRLHLQPDANMGNISIEGDFSNSTDASIGMAELVSSYNLPADSLNTVNGYAKINAPYTPQWSGADDTKVATLWDAEDVGIFRFAGNIFKGDGKIKFNNMQWVKPALGWLSGSNTRRVGTFTGTIDCYIYDKTALRDYVKQVLSYAPMNLRITSSVWNDYKSALSNAMQVLAKYETSQYEINQAYSTIEAAVNAIVLDSAISTQVANVTYYKHSGDYASSVAASTAPKYMLIPVGSHTVAGYDSYKTGTNKNSNIVTNYKVSDKTIQTIDYHYWNIDFSAVAGALASADAILEKNPWCYTDEYRTSLQTARNNLAAVDQTVHSATPELQSEVDNSVSAVNTLVAAEATESNHAHVKGDLQIDTAPDCYDTGLGHYDCKYCGVCVENNVEIPAKGHTWTDANCTAAKTCSVCGATEGTALGHTYTATVTAPTCTDKGYTTHTCSRCNDSYVDTYVNAKGHTPGAAATCTTAQTCTVCGTQIAPAKGHTWTDANCTAAKTCSVCGATEGTSLGHTYTATVTAPTCTDKGYTTHTCSRCNDSYVDTYTDALGHEFTAETATADYLKTAATCVDKAVYYKSCSRCGLTSAGTDNVVTFTSGDVDSTNHVNKKNHEETASTCTQIGYTAGVYCEDCDKWISGHTEISATNHANKVHHEKVDATCKTTGTIEYWYCPACLKSFSNEDCTTVVTDLTIKIDANNHTKLNKKDAVKETCTVDGNIDYWTCEGCGKIYSDAEAKREITAAQTVVKAKGHNFGAWAPAGDGTHKRECTVCTNETGRVETENCSDAVNDEDCNCDKCNAFVAHTPGAEATCTTAQICTVCGAELKEANGHTYSEWVEKVSETCMSDGTLGHHECSVCHKYFDADKNELENIIIEKDPKKHNMQMTSDSIAPTCTADGKQAVYTCANGCGHTTGGEVIKSTGHTWSTVYTNDAEQGKHYCTCEKCGAKEYADHTWSDGVIDPDSTCTQPGVITFTCLAHKCGATRTEEVALKAHTLTYVEAKSSTCTVDGNIEHWHCSVCGKNFADENATNVLDSIVDEKDGHDYNAVVTAPTCTTDGYTTHTCSKCNDSYVDTPVTALGHTWTVAYNFAENGKTCTATRVCGNDASHVETATAKITSAVKTPATCTVDGWTTYTATFDVDWAEAQTLDVVDIAAKNHAWADATYSFAADGKSCTATRVCGNDASHVETATAKITSAVKTPATCTEMGTTTYTATFAETWAVSKTKEVQDIPAINHDWKSEVTKEPGCETEGVMTYTCQNDNSHTYTEKINPLNHIDVDPADGTCDRCNAEICTHTNTKEIVRVEATCTQNGNIRYWTCDLCHKNFSDAECKELVANVVISASGHAWEVAYNFAADGKTCTATRTCGNDASHVETATAKITSAVTTPATCEDKGTTTYTATFDVAWAATQTKAVKDVVALGHKEVVKAAVLPTCEATGLTEGKYCSVCSKVLVAQTVVPAKGHNYGEWIEEVPATCISTGTKGHYDCSACDKYFDADKAELADLTIAINPDAHTYTSVVTAPTCDLPGYTTHTCSGCGDTKVDTYVDALGHKYEVTDHKDASCTAEGYDVYTCKNDTTHTYTEVLGKLAHTEEILPGKAATCNEEGLTEGKKCSVCGTVTVSQQTIPATGEHKEITIGDVPATCVSTGSKGKVVCEVCGITISEDEIIPKTDHQYGAAPIHVIPATCIKGKVSVYKCKFCDERKEVADPANEKAPHTIVEVCVVEATCEFSGVYSYYCTTCSETVKSETIPALGHTDKNGDELCDNCNGKYVDPDNNKVCGCICHKEGAFMKFIYKIVRFFWKLFKISKTCSCGAVHY